MVAPQRWEWVRVVWFSESIRGPATVAFLGALSNPDLAASAVLGLIEGGVCRS